MEIGLLISGQLGLVVFQRLQKLYKINFVLTDKNSTGIIEQSKSSGIRFFAGNPRKKKALNSLEDLTCDLLVSVNYLFLIEEDIIRVPKKLAINFHGSLLPKYRGRTPHVWAIINNETETGITAHLIETECDAGDILAQVRIPISKTDTGADVLEKFQKEYPTLVERVLREIEADKHVLTKQDQAQATYFGKRTSDDGKIDWNWQRERIHNWVRAQARPYPGAFTFYDSEKIIIHKIQFSEIGFHYDIPNGTIIGFDESKPVVKTPNGTVKLVDIECNFNLEPNQILK